MTFPRLTLLILSAALLSCASDKEHQKNLDDRNDAYAKYDNRRRARLEARQERTDRFYDRAFGRPPDTNTGLRVPGDP